MASRTPLPARHPPTGTWPALMRADLAAAYLDYRDTGELARAVGRGEAPPPTGYHGIGRAREPVWSIDRNDKTWLLLYETTPHCIEVSPLLPAKASEE